MLEFIGSGSAFNTKYGNNSAFIKRNDSLLLIDCGGTTFHRLIEAQLLKGVNQINALITHLHPDHIASLGDLIFYFYFMHNKKVNIITPDTTNIVLLLKHMGVDREMYGIKDLNEDKIIRFDKQEIKIDFVKASHVDTINCFSYIISIDDMCVYYSGDSNDIDEKVLKAFYDKEIDIIYQDTCMGKHKDVPHMHFERLCSLIERESRSKVYCMHLDEAFEAVIAQNEGFNVVRNFEY